MHDIAAVSSLKFSSETKESVRQTVEAEKTWLCEINE
jgi:hypothetical protein